MNKKLIGILDMSLIFSLFSGDIIIDTKRTIYRKSPLNNKQKKRRKKKAKNARKARRLNRK